MKDERIQVLLAWATAWISLMFFITPTQGANIVIGGNTTDIGTIIFLSPKPGDSPTTAGTALLNTIDGITDNSATSPYLIKLGPGVYDIGTSSLQMKEYVDVEGSGENTTVITGQTDTSSGVVLGADNAEIRFLTVRNTGGGTYAIAIWNESASPKITNVTASASGGSGPNIGVNNSSFSLPAMTNVTASASGGAFSYGVYNHSSSPTMTNVTASASGGTYNHGVNNDFSSSPKMTNVTASASGGTNSRGISNLDSSPTMTDVTASASKGQNNWGVYNGASSYPPTMTNVTASASEGNGPNYGVYNSGSSPTMTNVTASASGGPGPNHGVYNINSSATMTNVMASASGTYGANYGVLNAYSSPTMTNVTAIASGTYGPNYGVMNNNSSPTMTNITVSASGATYNFGVFSINTCTIMINNSVIAGSTNTIYNDPGTATRVGNTKLDGGPVFNASGSTLTCVGAYDGNYLALDTSCQ